jgi:hypothetical protein
MICRSGTDTIAAAYAAVGNGRTECGAPPGFYRRAPGLTRYRATEATAPAGDLNADFSGLEKIAALGTRERDTPAP